MKIFLIQTVTAYICSVVCAICFALIYEGLNILGINMEDFFVGGDKAQVFFSMFLGLPVGGLLGILLIHKLLEAEKSVSISGLLIGWLVSTGCVIGGIPLLDVFGSRAFMFFPLLASWAFMISYRVVLFVGLR